MKSALLTLAFLSTLGFQLSTALATTRSYNCNSANNQWSVAANWVPVGVPQNGDTLVFGSLAGNRDTFNDLASLRLDSIQVTTSGYWISGNTITISNGLTAAAASGLEIHPDLVLGRSQTFNFDTMSSAWIYGDVNLNGFNLIIDSDSYLETRGAFTGNGNLTKSGTGDVLMTGPPNTFNGSLAHNSGGQFTVAKPSCFPTNYQSFGLTVLSASSATHTNGDITLFPGAKIIGAGGSVTNTIRHLTLSGASIEDVSSRLILRGNVTSFASSTESKIFAQLDLLNTNHTFSIADGTADRDLRITFGSLNGGALAGFTKVGNGKLFMEQLSSSYGGTNQIVAGIVEAGLGGAMLGTGRTVVQDGASIQLLSGSGLSSYLELNGDGVGGTNGALRGFGLAHAYGTFLIRTGATIRADGEVHLDGNIAGAGELRITGTDELWTQGAANTLVGGYRVKSGTFVLNKANGITAVGSPILVGSGGLFPLSATLRNFESNQITAHVTIEASGRYELNGQTETLPSLDLTIGSEVWMGGGRLILAGDLVVSPDLFPGAAEIDGGGFLDVGTGTRNLIVHGPLAGVVGSVPLLDIQSTILTGGANILKQGAGALRIQNSANYTGTLTIENGDVEVISFDGFGGGASTIVTSSGAFVLSGSGQSDTEPLTFNGTGRVDSASWVIKDATSWRGAVTLLQDARVSVASNTVLSLLASISGAGGLVKEGPGEMLFDWIQPNTFTGGLVVKEGRVTLAREVTNLTIVSEITIGDGLGAAASAQLLSSGYQQIGNTADVTLASDGRFIVTNMIFDAETIRRLQGSGQLHLYGFGLRISDSGLDSVFNGSISGTGDLTKAGMGKFTHNGNCTASGLTLSMFGGNTAINGTWSASPTPTFIDAYSGTVLSGEGTVQDVNIRSGGVLAPGNSPGIFTLNNLKMTNGANLFMELRGTTPGVLHDQVAANILVNISNATLTLALNYPPTEGDVLRLVDNRGANPILGTFSGLPHGSTVTLSGNQFVISYAGGDGNDITLTAVNSKLALTAATITSGNGRLDPGECNELYVVLTNKSGGALSGVTARLDSKSPGTAVSQQGAAYANFTANSTRTNLTPFRISSLPGFVCGQTVELQLTVTAGGSTFAIPITLDTGTLGAPSSFNAASPISIPDVATTNSTINVAAFSNLVAKVVVSFHITHTYDADLDISLQSPSGKLVKLVADRGASADNFGTNCSPAAARTTFDDTSRNDIATAAAPFVGTFSPEEPLSEFKGETANGAWKLIITDDAGGDTGTLNCWTLTLYATACTADSLASCQPCAGETAGALTAQSPTLPHRMVRDGNPTVCGETKLCPGNSVAGGTFRYATHTYTNTGAGGCVTVVLNDHCGNALLFAAAYLGVFNPADLCAGYLADTGTNALASSMSLYVVSNGVFTVVVNELAPNLACTSYGLEIFGLPCPAPTLQVAPAPAGKVRLFWNALGGDGYDLQAAPVVTGATFTNVGLAPAFVNGTFNITNTAGGPEKYFRLKKP